MIKVTIGADVFLVTREQLEIFIDNSKVKILRNGRLDIDTYYYEL